METVHLAILLSIAAIILSILSVLRGIITHNVVNELVSTCQDIAGDVKTLKNEMTLAVAPHLGLPPEARVWLVRAGNSPENSSATE